MKKIILILAVILSANTYAVGNDGSDSKSIQICTKVGNDGSDSKVGNDGSDSKVGNDGSDSKTICQIINIEERESFFNFEFNRY